MRLDELEASRAEQSTSSAAAPALEGSGASKPVRRPLPEYLPRDTRKIPPKPTACHDCGGALKYLGEDVSVPASFKVLQQVRPKLACGRCDKIVQAEAPSRPIARGPGRSGPAGARAGVEIL